MNILKFLKSLFRRKSPITFGFIPENGKFKDPKMQEQFERDVLDPACYTPGKPFENEDGSPKYYQSFWLVSYPDNEPVEIESANIENEENDGEGINPEN